MSVLVEALSLVVPRAKLDASWPGGADDFLWSIVGDDSPARYVCTDDRLASISFLDPDKAVEVAERLVDAGLVQVDEKRFVDFAFVDQHFGPMMPCDWLAWERHAEGFTYAWPSGEEPGDMAAPEGWTPEQSRGLTRNDVRDEPGRMMPLSSEEGLETWLDFETGQMIQGFPHRADVAPTAASAMEPPGSLEERTPDPGSLEAVVLSVIVESNSRYRRFGEKAFALRATGDKASYEILLTVDEQLAQVGCLTFFASNAPEPRRVAMAETVVRANYYLLLGNFDLDFADGELRFRVAMDVEGGALVPAMVRNLIALSIASCERHHDAFMSVMFGGTSPQDALATLHQ